MLQSATSLKNVLVLVGYSCSGYAYFKAVSTISSTVLFQMVPLQRPIVNICVKMKFPCIRIFLDSHLSEFLESTCQL